MDGQVDVGNPIALTFYVAPTHLAEAEAKARSIQTPGSWDYHHFLTRQEFTRDYTVSDPEIQRIEASLVNLGFTIAYEFPNHLAIEVTGNVGTAEQALSVNLKQFTKNGRVGLAPDRAITLPPALQGVIRNVGGLNTLNRPRPMLMRSPIAGQSTTRVAGSADLVGGTSGNYLPADFARFYGVDPLYNQGFIGRGSTIGIVTLNDFKPADAFSFWSKTGLSVSPTRITKVDVDGGTTAATNNLDGEGETDLDVEYSGAIAPQANVRVYIAPNITESNFINAFEAAASENIADTVSTSWGEPELFYFAFLDPAYASETSLLDDFHDVFLEMALQGQTLFAASGDSGAFDTVRDCPAFGTPTPKTPVCNAPYSVDFPSSDPLVTAAGGTTLPLDFTTHRGVHLDVPKERAWSWDYIVTAAAEQGFGAVDPLSRLFSVGDGGGVSSYFARPWYQHSVPGMTNTMPGQYFAEDIGMGSTVQVILPAEFAGRNSPDISTDADPESGYQYIEEGAIQNFYGGTSFVAPQLNGVTALFVQALGGRVGQLNPALYQLRSPDTKDLTLGDNWGYAAIPGFDNASGVGTLDAATLLKGLETLKATK